LKNFLFYTLIVLLVVSFLSFVVGYWKIGMLSGFILGGLATGVSVIYSVKSHEYGHGPLHNGTGIRGKKFGD
jgi:hypothetical protein